MLLFIAVIVFPLLIIAIVMLVLILTEDRKLIKYAEQSLKRKLSFFEKRMIWNNLAGCRSRIIKCMKQNVPFRSFGSSELYNQITKSSEKEE